MILRRFLFKTAAKYLKRIQQVSHQIGFNLRPEFIDNSFNNDATIIIEKIIKRVAAFIIRRRFGIFQFSSYLLAYEENFLARPEHIFRNSLENKLWGVRYGAAWKRNALWAFYFYFILLVLNFELLLMIFKCQISIFCLKVYKLCNFCPILCEGLRTKIVFKFITFSGIVGIWVRFLGIFSAPIKTSYLNMNWTCMCLHVFCSHSQSLAKSVPKKKKGRVCLVKNNEFSAPIEVTGGNVGETVTN